MTSFGSSSCPTLFALTLVHSILFTNFATVVKFTANFATVVKFTAVKF